jgi:hypothetical protein
VARAPELQRSMFGGHGPGGTQAPQEQKGALSLAPGKRPPPPFLRVWLPAVALGDFSCKMTFGRAAGGGIKHVLLTFGRAAGGGIKHVLLWAWLVWRFSQTWALAPHGPGCG